VSLFVETLQRALAVVVGAQKAFAMTVLQSYACIVPQYPNILEMTIKRKARLAEGRAQEVAEHLLLRQGRCEAESPMNGQNTLGFGICEQDATQLKSQIATNGIGAPAE
jgi:hypothetical protein